VVYSKHKMEFEAEGGGLTDRSVYELVGIVFQDETGFMLNESLPERAENPWLGTPSKEVGRFAFGSIEPHSKLINACIMLNFLRSNFSGSVKQSLEVSLRVFCGPDFPRFHRVSPRTQ
jgi:hypothetical protein